MLDKNECIRIGRAVKSHGVGGEVVLRPSEGFECDCFECEFLLFDLDGGLVPFAVESVRPKGAEAIVKLELCNDAAAAKRLVGTEVYIEREEAEEMYGGDDDEQIAVGMLVGFEAYDVALGAIGSIVALENANENNPLFVVENNGREFYVPVADELIAEVDVKGKRLTFDLPEGLIEIND